MRRRILRISMQLLEDFLRVPVPPGLTAEGFPADAKITGACIDPMNSRVIILVVESAEFSAADPEEMTVTFTQTQ